VNTKIGVYSPLSVLVPQAELKWTKINNLSDICHFARAAQETSECDNCSIFKPTAWRLVRIEKM